jgi:hypothetical protein
MKIDSLELFEVCLRASLANSNFDMLWLDVLRDIELKEAHLWASPEGEGGLRRALLW